MENYNVDYFIKKFEAIPECAWCSFVQDDGDKHCAYGHCNKENDVFWALVRLDRDYSRKLYLGECFLDLPQAAILADINNGGYSNYNQSNPKARTLAALYDIKAIIEEEEQQQKNIDFTNQLISQSVLEEVV